MMRLNFKTVLLVLVVGTLSFLLTTWNNCGGSLLFHADWKTKYQHKVRYHVINVVFQRGSMIYIIIRANKIN